MDVNICSHFAQFVKIPFADYIVVFVFAGGDVGGDGQPVVVLRCFSLRFFHLAGYGRLQDGYFDVLDEFLAHNDVSVCSNVKYLFDLASFEFECVVGAINHPGVDVEGVYFYIFVVLN